MRLDIDRRRSGGGSSDVQKGNHKELDIGHRNAASVEVRADTPRRAAIHETVDEELYVIAIDQIIAVDAAARVPVVRAGVVIFRQTMIARMSTAPEIADLLMFAVDAARLGGELALSWAGSRETAAKLDASPVTAADHAVQAAILDRVAQRFPDHAVLVEETLLDAHRHGGRDAEYCWVVDPIDGTRNFARGSRSFATSVALLQHGRPLVGAIYDGRNGTICCSGRGRGAFCTQEKQSAMHVTDVPLDERSVIAISSFHGMPMPPAIRALIDVVFLRSLGSLCLHLVGVASGDFDALHSQDAKLWDIAAGTLLIEEAGGVVTHPDGRPLWPVDMAAYSGEDLPLIGGGARIHADLVARLSAG